MSYAFVQIGQLISVALSLRSSLKCLKGLSSHSSDGVNKGHRSSEQQLMFWVVFALLSMYEKYFEFIFRWIPCYYYAKLVFILAISFPSLRITNLIFWDFHVVIIDYVYKILNAGNTRTAYAMAMDFPFFILLLVFPALGITENEMDEPFTDSVTEVEAYIATTFSPGEFQQGHIIEETDSTMETHENEKMKKTFLPAISLKNIEKINKALENDPKFRPSIANIDTSVGSGFRTPSNLSDLNIEPGSPIRITTPTSARNIISSPKSLKVAKQETSRRLSSLTEVIRCLTPKMSPSPRRDSPMPSRNTTGTGIQRVSYRTRTNSSSSPNTTDSTSRRGQGPRAFNSTSPTGGGTSPPRHTFKKSSIDTQKNLRQKNESKENLFQTSASSEMSNVGVERAGFSPPGPGPRTQSMIGSLFGLNLNQLPLNSVARSEQNKNRRSSLGTSRSNP
jgi:TB2/DP1, HVA22 family